MILRSGRKKPYQVPPRRRQSAKKQFLLTNRSTASRKTVFSLRKTVKCYILTEDSKTVHFDIDEDGHHEICTKDSQSYEDIAWLRVFTRNEGVTGKPLVGKKGIISSLGSDFEDTLESRKRRSQRFTHRLDIRDSKNLVILTQRSKLNEFVLLCKGKKHLSLKVLKASCSEPDHPSVGKCNMETCSHEDPDFKQLNEDNNFFIMHYQGDSVQFQCYEDRRYYLCVNDDSLDIRKLESRDPNKDKNFYFRVLYLQEQ